MIYFTSDLHFGHQNILKYCPDRSYSSAEEMNEMMVLNWNNIVKPEDTVICVGDFSLSFVMVESFTPRLNGHKILVCGNHDFVHPYHKKSRQLDNREKYLKEYKRIGWKEIAIEKEIELPEIGKVKVCHLPYPEDFAGVGDDKYEKHRPIDEGQILLCGHVHQAWKSKKSKKGTLMINVGVDVNDMKPISQDDLVSYIKEQMEK